jgi:hypothetical protein
MSASKDQAVLNLLAKLPTALRGWIAVDHWDADRCAIGIAQKESPRHLVYISTFGKKQFEYDYECEKPVGGAGEDYETVERGSDVGFEVLLQAIERHLA